MIFENLKQNDIISIRVKTCARDNKVYFDEKKDIIKVDVKSLPIENKANNLIVKIFKKQLNLNVEIIGGFKSKIKKIKIN